MANKNNIETKEKQVKELAEKIKASKVVLLTDYRGINAEDITKLRAELRGIKTEYLVIKNNITRRALKECKIDGLDDCLIGPTAIIMCEEEYLAPIKSIYNYVKDHDFYKIKGGVIEGKVSDENEITVLAQLPSREELIAKLAGALLGNITKLAIALDAVKVQKETA
ncbi:MAG: 50S ribosomal protein L10 [Oscillospiraceae bacterium]|nr:50S ribosomal protein L10 [Oscillospiraceae bacterium]